MSLGTNLIWGPWEILVVFDLYEDVKYKGMKGCKASEVADAEVGTVVLGLRIPESCARPFF